MYRVSRSKRLQARFEALLGILIDHICPTRHMHTSCLYATTRVMRHASCVMRVMRDVCVCVYTRIEDPLPPQKIKRSVFLTQPLLSSRQIFLKL